MGNNVGCHTVTGFVLFAKALTTADAQRHNVVVSYYRRARRHTVTGFGRKRTAQYWTAPFAAAAARPRSSTRDPATTTPSRLPSEIAQTLGGGA